MFVYFLVLSQKFECGRDQNLNVKMIHKNWLFYLFLHWSWVYSKRGFVKRKKLNHLQVSNEQFICMPEFFNRKFMQEFLNRKFMWDYKASPEHCISYRPNDLTTRLHQNASETIKLTSIDDTKKFSQIVHYDAFVMTWKW